MIEQERGVLLDLLRIDSEPVVSGADALELFAEPTSRPLVALYSGHGKCSAYEPGHRNRCALSARSELCFEDEDLAVDELLARIPAQVEYAALVLNACFSANVDVRRSAAPASVLSASPSFVTANDGRTVLGPWLEGALRGSGDANADGQVDDRELLEYLWQQAEGGRRSEPRLEGSLMPKLRRQAWASLPLFATGARAKPWLPEVEREFRHWGLSEAAIRNIAEREEALRDGRLTGILGQPHTYFVRELDTPPRENVQRIARSLRASEGFLIEATGTEATVVLVRDAIGLASAPLSDLDKLMATVEAGHWANLRVTLRGTVVWHGGRVADPLELPSGERLGAQELLATPCLEEFGQCFLTTNEAQP